MPPQSSHHVVEVDDTGLITHVMPVRELRQWENGGYFIMRPEIFDYLDVGEDLLADAIPRLIAAAEGNGLPVQGLLVAADTVKERAQLEEMYYKGNCPWMVWDQERSGGAAMPGKGTPVAQPGFPGSVVP